MALKKAEFKFLDRGYQETLLCLHGWACDYRMFSRLNLTYNYLFAQHYSPFDFSAPLADYLHTLSAGKISLLGFSLGGFLAVEFSAHYPEMVKGLILLGIRKKYPAKPLQEIKDKLLNNRKAFLYRFYRDCFSKADAQEARWFKENLLEDYVRGMELKELIAGLDYLKEARIEPRSLERIDSITIFHGEDDRIAPITEAEGIASQIPIAQFIALPKRGHFCFLSHELEKT